MAWLVALCFSVASGESFIQLKDKEFLGEDKRVTEILRHRIQDVRLPPLTSDPNYADTFMHTIDQLELIDALRMETRRKSHFPKVPPDKEMKQRTIDLMQQMIYDSQVRIEQMENALSKYANDVSYRVGYIYSSLTTVHSDMVIMLSRINRTLEDKHKSPKNRVYTHLIYYNYFLKKNLDYTYISEYLVGIYASTRLATIATNTTNKATNSTN